MAKRPTIDIANALSGDTRAFRRALDRALKDVEPQVVDRSRRTTRRASSARAMIAGLRGDVASQVGWAEQDGEITQKQATAFAASAGRAFTAFEGRVAAEL